MSERIVRTKADIQAIQDWIQEGRDMGGHYPAQSYEDGLQAMLDWLTDLECDDPRE